MEKDFATSTMEFFCCFHVSFFVVWVCNGIITSSKKDWDVVCCLFCSHLDMAWPMYIGYMGFVAIRWINDYIMDTGCWIGLHRDG